MMQVVRMFGNDTRPEAPVALTAVVPVRREGGYGGVVWTLASLDPLRLPGRGWVRELQPLPTQIAR